MGNRGLRVNNSLGTKYEIKTEKKVFIVCNRISR